MKLRDSRGWNNYPSPKALLEAVPGLTARKRRLLCVALIEPAWGLCEGRPWALQREMAGLLLRLANHPSLDSLDGCQRDLKAAADRLLPLYNPLKAERM